MGHNNRLFRRYEFQLPCDVKGKTADGRRIEERTHTGNVSSGGAMIRSAADWDTSGKLRVSLSIPDELADYFQAEEFTTEANVVNVGQTDDNEKASVHVSFHDRLLFTLRVQEIPDHRPAVT